MAATERDLLRKTAGAPETLGKLLRVARLERRLSQEALSRRSGVSRETIARIEAGRPCQPETLCRIEDGLRFADPACPPPWREPRELFGQRALVSEGWGYVARVRRRQLGMTLQQVGAIAGVSASTVSRFERFSDTHGLLAPLRYNEARELIPVLSPALLQALGFADQSDLDAYQKRLVTDAMRWSASRAARRGRS